MYNPMPPQTPQGGPQRGEPRMLPSSNERTMALLAHLSIWIPQLGLIAPLIIWLANRESAPFAAYQAKQAFFFHLAVAVGFWVFAAVGFVLSILTLGLFLIVLIPALGAWHLAAAIYGTIGALQANEGRDFRYAGLGSLVQPD